MAITQEKRLARSTTDKKIAGVCGGLGAYFGVDPTLIRIIWFILALVPGPALIPYIVLWIVLPEDSALPPSRGAVAIAEERYARGEITAQQLEAIRRDLG